MDSMYLSIEGFTCPKEQIIHKELSLALITYFVDTMHKHFKNSMKPDINSIENSVDPGQLASEEVWILFSF